MVDSESDYLSEHLSFRLSRTLEFSAPQSQLATTTPATSTTMVHTKYVLCIPYM